MGYMKTDQKYKSFMSIPTNNIALLKEITDKLNRIFQGRREIMYSDIINLIIMTLFLFSRFSIFLHEFKAETIFSLGTVIFLFSKVILIQ